MPGFVVDAGMHEVEPVDNEAVSTRITVLENGAPGANCLMFADGVDRRSRRARGGEPVSLRIR